MLNQSIQNKSIINSRGVISTDYKIVHADEAFYKFVGPTIQFFTDSVHQVDMDDFDYGLIYKTNPDDFINVLRELINWMRDHEQGIRIYESIWNVYDFFPDCGCERTKW